MTNHRKCFIRKIEILCPSINPTQNSQWFLSFVFTTDWIGLCESNSMKPRSIWLVFSNFPLFETFQHRLHLESIEKLCKRTLWDFRLYMLPSIDVPPNNKHINCAFSKFAIAVLHIHWNSILKIQFDIYIFAYMCLGYVK